MRNPAKEARFTSTDGRQTDRRKMRRAKPIVVRRPELVPILTDEEFERVQSLLEHKRANNWRFRVPDPGHARFAYRGFIFCAECGSVHYTISTNQSGRRYDHYVCKRRKGYGPRSSGQITIPLAERCPTDYLSRNKIEPMIDSLLADRLTDKGFIRECIEQAMRENSPDETDKQSVVRLQRLIEKLRTRRTRVIQNFEDGDIDRDQKRERLAKIDAEIQATEFAMMEASPAHSDLEPASIVDELAPLSEFKSLNTEHKRRILNVLEPEIRVANYELKGISLDLPSLHSSDDGHSGLALQAGGQNFSEMALPIRMAY